MVVLRALAWSLVVAALLSPLPLRAPFGPVALADPGSPLVLARDAWKDPRVFEAWWALDPGTPRGAEARRRLSLADAAYRHALVAWREDRGAEASEAFATAARTAPIDPELLVDVAARYEEQGDFARAESFYALYVGARPEGRHAPEVRRALERLAAVRAAASTGDPLPRAEPEPPAAVERPAAVPGASADAPRPQVRFTARERLFLGISVFALLVALGLVVRVALDRRLSLDALAELHPEQHASIAYLVGSLRHELLKHRLFGLSGLPQALDRRERKAFVRARLFGGKPLSEAWAEHREAFERELGPSFGFRRDPWLRRAEKAIRRLERLGARDDEAADAEIALCLDELVSFDRHLATLVRSLVRTRIDRCLLEGVLEDVRREPSAGSVELDEVVVRAPDEPLFVEVYRQDLRLVLKNLVRNALLALGAGPAPRRFALEAELELLPSGEELVRIEVRDTAAGSLAPERLERSSVDRGLGLVRVTLSRYGGTLDVEPRREGQAKSVVVRFFRAYADEPAPASGILAP